MIVAYSLTGRSWAGRESVASTRVQSGNNWLHVNCGLERLTQLVAEFRILTLHALSATHYRLWEGEQRTSSFFCLVHSGDRPILLSWFPLLLLQQKWRPLLNSGCGCPTAWGASNPSIRNNPRPLTVDSVVEFWVLPTHGSQTSTGFLRRIKKFSARIIMKRMNLWHRIFSISSAW